DPRIRGAWHRAWRRDRRRPRVAGLPARQVGRSGRRGKVRHPMGRRVARSRLVAPARASVGAPASTRTGSVSMAIEEREGITVTRTPVLDLRPNGTLIYNEMAVGKLDTDAMLDDGTNARIILNLGWMKAAGLRITVQADPEVDHK